MSYSQVSKKKIDRLWGELYHLKKSNKEFENFAVLDRIQELLDEFNPQDFESKYFSTISKIIQDINENINLKAKSVQTQWTIINDKISTPALTKKISPPKQIKRSPSLSDISNILPKKDLEIIQDIVKIIQQREKEKDIRYAIEQARSSTEKSKQLKQIRQSSLKKYISKSRKDSAIKIKSKVKRTSPRNSSQTLPRTSPRSSRKSLE